MKSTLLVFLLFTGFFAVGQTDFDQRLLAKFSADQLNDLQQSKPSVVEFWTYFLNSGYEIRKISIEKPNSYSGTIDLPVDSWENLNLFELNLPHPLEEASIYRIDGSDHVLILYSRNSLVKSFNKSITAR